MLRIQYASNLAGYVAPSCRIKPLAPILALLGNIGQPRDPGYARFLEDCSRRWQAVFVVAGPIELETSPNGTTVGQQLEFCKNVTIGLPNVKFLHHERADYDGVAFLGATYWSDRKGLEDLRVPEHNRMRVSLEGQNRTLRPAGPVDTTNWHLADWRWIQDSLGSSEQEGRPTVVLTHHRPLSSVVGTSPLRAWISGEGLEPARSYIDVSTVKEDTRDPLLVASSRLDVEPPKAVSSGSVAPRTRGALLQNLR
jgi:hypothetical protein